MYLGRIVETADSDELCDRPLHPYTQALFAACLPDDPDAAHGNEGRAALQGEVPSPIDPPPGCPFHTRCPHVRPVCTQQEQWLRENSPGHAVACVLYDESIQ
jgi:oligopeptide/dipeptide ABC transporter ATP-binding protein